MKDSDFKYLSHRVGELRIATRGTEVSEGYKPDLTVTDANGHLMFIVECEQKTDRKAFLGALLKAEKYAEDCHANPILVIVMQPLYNTTVEQIAHHIRPYALWLSGLKENGLNLSQVVVLSDQEYRTSVEANESLCSPGFLTRAMVIEIPRPNNSLNMDAHKTRTG